MVRVVLYPCAVLWAIERRRLACYRAPGGAFGQTLPDPHPDLAEGPLRTSPPPHHHFRNLPLDTPRTAVYTSRMPPTADVLLSSPAALGGRSAPEPDIVRWVARNIDNPKVNPADCPDPFAWTLLRQCKSSPEFQGFFIEKLWSKLLPSRAQMDNQSEGVELDGQHVIAMIDRIRGLAGRSKPKAKRPEAEAVVVDTFADFEGEESI